VPRHNFIVLHAIVLHAIILHAIVDSRRESEIKLCLGTTLLYYMLSYYNNPNKVWVISDSLRESTM